MIADMCRDVDCHCRGPTLTQSLEVSGSNNTWRGDGRVKEQKGSNVRNVAMQSECAASLAWLCCLVIAQKKNPKNPINKNKDGVQRTCAMSPCKARAPTVSLSCAASSFASFFVSLKTIVRPAPTTVNNVSQDSETENDTKQAVAGF